MFKDTFLLDLTQFIFSEWTVDNYADVGLLLSQCQNVYSAEVPTAMQVCIFGINRSQQKKNYHTSKI